QALDEAERLFSGVGGRALIPAIPGLDQVPYFTNSTMMDVDYLPEHLIVLGGSYVGLEFGQMYRRFGARDQPRALLDDRHAREDEDVSHAVREILEGEGIDVRRDADCLSVRRDGGGVAVGLDCAAGPRGVRGAYRRLAVGAARTP
ncbi:FAD-dependent oxidoreductase, partial [Burkholderia pseudomallei]|uniref:FAD-dependent oxidoreductase n=1 Tax=Burkholderia pseudomallei TaxID=28450 RepID=UPI00406C7563